MSGKSNQIIYLSTFPPRECGIATFTQDLATAFDKRFNPLTRAKVVALNETQTSFYNYPKRVIGSIGTNILENYVALAEKINKNEDIKLVNIQHEFGLFGGEWGDYLIPFMQVIRKPVVITFHSVLPDPEDYLKRIVEILGFKSKAIVVMNERSRNILENDYGIASSKIFLIPHGIPPTTFEQSKVAKTELGLEGNTILSTFGMISRDKGIEYAIRALPKVVKKFPNVKYLVIGATHPLVRRGEGEIYRNFLQKEVDRLNLKEHVLFYNKYLPLEEIIKYLKATDVYLSPVANPMQSVSGTLSYALGCGRAVLSTPTEYAKHIIKEGENGFLVKFKNSSAIEKRLIELLANDKYLRHLHRGAYESTRHMTWPNVSAAYFKVYKKFTELKAEEKKLPAIKLDHLVRLTDNFGIAHHARYSHPEKRFGYSMDDNARALIASALYYKMGPQQEIVDLMRTYLGFIKFVQRSNGSFANIVNSRKQKDKTTDEDVQGRGLWALGFTASCGFLPKGITKEANLLFFNALTYASKIKSPRAVAFAMTGLYHHIKTFGGQRTFKLFQTYAGRQIALFQKNASEEWGWFEDNLTYSNSKLPESLFYAYEILKDKKYLSAAESSLSFLSNITYGKYYMPIGQNGWYFRYKKRAYFDQHPEDAASMVETKLAAYRATCKKNYLDEAIKTFRWFLGDNHLNQMVYDEVTGGCNDGLGQHGLNLNQGAESTVSYLLARLALENSGIKYENKRKHI